MANPERTRIITFGCWDLLHVGHIRFLKSVRKYGGFLIVGIASDEVVKQDKGIAPVIPQEQRFEMLMELECVNFVFVYNDFSPSVFADCIVQYHTSILAVGGDWGKEERHILAEQMVYSLDGVVLRQNRTDGVSTSMIINKILKERRNQ